MKRPLALLLAWVLMVGFFQGYGALVNPRSAEATYATGGLSNYRGAIDWFQWGNKHGDNIPLGVVTKTNTRTIAGRTLVTTCTLSRDKGLLQAYRPGDWVGDGFDELYNIG